MKCVSIGVLLFLLTLPRVQAQGIDAKTFDRYEEQKKDKALGLVWWSVFPGAGIIYADGSQPVLWMVGEIGLVVLAIQPDRPLWPVAALVVMRVAELAETFRLVGKYNERLRVNLGLKSLGIRGRSSSIQLTISLAV